MKYFYLFPIILILFSCESNKGEKGVRLTEINSSKSDTQKIKEGDIIFHTSHSSQSEAIQIVTRSKYSHVGIIFKNKEEEWVVYEAVQPVKVTPLNEWQKRGVNGHYIIKRIQGNKVNESIISEMKKSFQKYEGKNYDFKFEWSDEKIYCSELVWKMYKEVLDMELGKLQQFKEFDFSNKIVQAKIKERYGKEIPLDEWVITPDRIFQSEKLEPVDY